MLQFRRPTFAWLCIALAVFAPQASALAETQAPTQAGGEKPPELVLLKKAVTGFMPKGVTVSTDGKLAFVTNFGAMNHDNVRAYDTETLEERWHVDFPGNSVESVVSPDGKTLYVSNFSKNQVEFIDLATHSVRASVKTGQHPKIVVVSRDGSRLFSANWGTNDVTVIDTASATVLVTKKVGKQPRGMAIKRDGTLFVADFWSDKLHVFDGMAEGAPERSEAKICSRPRHLALSDDDTTLFMSCLLGSKVAALDVRTNVSEDPSNLFAAPVGSAPKSIYAQGDYVYSADFVGNGVSTVNSKTGASRIQRVAGLQEASGIAAIPSAGRVLVTGWLDGHLYLLGKKE
jgi:YVTN family beta-propeller protein